MTPSSLHTLTDTVRVCNRDDNPHKTIFASLSIGFLLGTSWTEVLGPALCPCPNDLCDGWKEYMTGTKEAFGLARLPGQCEIQVSYLDRPLPHNLA